VKAVQVFTVSITARKRTYRGGDSRQKERGNQGERDTGKSENDLGDTSLKEISCRKRNSREAKKEG